MNVKELQIGDYVRISHRNKIGKVYRIDRANGEGNGYAAVIDGDYHEMILEPIPLEKIHLAKNGFKPTDETDREFVFYDGYNIKVLFEEGCEIYEQDGKTLFDKIPPSMFLTINFAEKDVWMPIEYVHELQHAMRLFGIEKEIEL